MQPIWANQVSQMSTVSLLKKTPILCLFMSFFDWDLKQPKNKDKCHVGENSIQLIFIIEANAMHLWIKLGHQCIWSLDVDLTIVQESMSNYFYFLQSASHQVTIMSSYFLFSIRLSSSRTRSTLAPFPPTLLIISQRRSWKSTRTQ